MTTSDGGPSMVLTPPSDAQIVAATQPYSDTAPSDAASSSSGRPLLPSSHPISLKLRSILTKPTSDYDNEVARKALKALEELYPASESSRGKQKASEGVEQDKSRPRRRTAKRSSVIAAAGQQTAANEVDITKAKANLERDAQLALIQSGDDFLKILEEVDEAIEDVSDNVRQMGRACDDIDARLTSTNDATRWLLEQAEGLQRQRATTSQQAQLLDLFLARFTLTPAEAETISNRDLPVSKSLFNAMDRLSQIRIDCRALLEGGGEIGGGTRAGTDVMASTSAQLDAAYDKIGRYLSFQFRQTPKEGLDVSDTLREAVKRAMDEREDLLRAALQTLVSIRSSHLSSSFQQALTRGSPAFNSRPIELHAHDPLRYVGDMLAWVHQAVASEREFLGQLLGEAEGEGGRKTGERRRGIEGSIDWSSADKGLPQGKKAIYMRELLDRCLEGCCRPLQVRIEQTTRSQEGCIVPFKLANLVQFYKVTMQSTLGSKVSLTKTLEEISTSSYQAFFANLERQGRSLLRFIQPPESNLSPPASLVGAIDSLREILFVHQASVSESSMNGSKGPANEEISASIADFDAVVTQLLDPMLELVKRMEDALTEGATGRGPEELNKAKKQGLVLRVNCVESVLNTLSRYEFVPLTTQRLQKVIDDTAVELAEVDYGELLVESGLAPIIAAIDTKNEATPLSHHPTTTPPQIQGYLGTFSTFLSSPSLLSPTLFTHLSSPSIRSSVHDQALHRLAGAYERVFDAIKEERNRFEWSGTVLKRSKEEVRMLLGVEA